VLFNGGQQSGADVSRVPRFARGLVHRVPVVQALVGGVALLVVVLAGPPAFAPGHGTLGFNLFVSVLAVVVTGLVLALGRRYGGSHHWRRWALIALVSFVAGALFYFACARAVASFTEPYHDTRIIVGSDADFTPKARQYLEQHHLSTAAQLIEDFPGEIQDFWSPGAILLRYLVVVSLYLAAVNALTACVLATLQAVFCAYRPRKLTDGAERSSRGEVQPQSDIVRPAPRVEGEAHARRPEAPMIPQPDIDHLVDLLANNAAGAPLHVGVVGYFRNLINAADLPNEYKLERADGWTGAATYDARELVNWAWRKGVNPQDTRYTTLGSALQAFLRQQPGVEQASLVVALMVRHRLVDGDPLLGLKTAYQVPQPAEALAAARPYGPDFTWRGPAVEAPQFQAWLRRAPELLDVGVLERALKQARGVCRVERADGTRVGTGFLVAPGLLLTNYHVLSWDATPSLPEFARGLRLRFGCFSEPDGSEADGKTFTVDPRGPVVKSSPKEDLDYALLRVEEAVLAVPAIQHVSLETGGLPHPGDALHILQHPEGKPLKLALSDNGVAGVYEGEKLLQYATPTKGGSSGSPCFNNHWKAVALHQAEVPLPIGSRRQGVLLQAILREIEIVLH
jgi:hypothetical protein